MKTQKEIEERKRDLRYIHQKAALQDTVIALRKIADDCKRSLDYAKANNYKPSRTAQECLAEAKEALAKVEAHKKAFIEDLREKRPAAPLGAFGEWDE